MISAQDRLKALELIDEAVGNGARIEKACEVVGISARTCQNWKYRWSKRQTLTDKRTTRPQLTRYNAFSEEEKLRIIKRYCERDVASLPLNQAFYKLLDSGVYLGSISTVYRVMKAANLNEYRNVTRRPTKRHAPTTHEATGPNQVWSWDITYFRDSSCQTRFYYGYVIVDVYSRYVIRAQVFDADSAKNAAEFLAAAFRQHGIRPRRLVLHSDNGASMKATITQAVLERYGVQGSHSRPRVSNDNPYSESLFKTLKYTGVVRYPRGGLPTVEAWQNWLDGFVIDYNENRFHSGIGFLTPKSRHLGEDAEILQKRKVVIENAFQAHPERWIQGHTLNCEPIGSVFLNPERMADHDEALAHHGAGGNGFAGAIHITRRLPNLDLNVS